MRKRQVKKSNRPKAIKIPKAPDPVVSAQPNARELKDPKVRRLGLSALKNTALKNTNPENASLNNAANFKTLEDPAPRRKPPRRPHLPFNVNSIQSYPELLAALEAKAVQITLGANIIAPDNILINHDVAINFNGYNIISEETNPGARVFDIRSGEVTLTGKGKIFAMGARSVAIRAFGAISIGMPAYTTLTIDEGISLFAPDSYGILISPNLGVAYGLIINLSGEIVARDGIGLSSRIRGRETNLPTINLKSGARITADENRGSALEAAGYAIWNLGPAKLTGATGALLKSGQINFSHTEIIATGPAFSADDLLPPKTPVAEGDLSPKAKIAPEEDPMTTAPEDPTPQNAAIRIAPAAKHDLNIIVEGGTYLGEKSFAVAGDPSSLESFVIKGGDFSGAIDVLHHAIEPELDIEEGSFSLHPALHLKALRPEIVLLPEPEPETQKTPEALPKTSTNLLKTEARPVATSQTAPENQPIPASQPLANEVVPKKPALPLPPTYDEAECAEKIAMTSALADALCEMKSLKASDYEVGFSELEAAIDAAEQLLSAKIITLPAIRDAASNLLAAFDNLEERDEFSLTDEELDQLFYHGAILDELAAEPEPTPSKKKSLLKPSPKSAPSIAAPQLPKTPQAPEAPKNLESAQTPELPNAPKPSETSAPASPDLSALAAVIQEISALDPAAYAADTYNILLSELARTKSLLAGAAPQPAIDAAAQKLKSLLANLIPLTASLASPQPLASFLVDETVPTHFWSTGVTLIDESDPHLCLAGQLPKSLRPGLHLDFSPVSNFFKGFAAAFHAGLDAYRRVRRTAKTN